MVFFTDTLTDSRLKSIHSFISRASRYAIISFAVETDENELHNVFLIITRALGININGISSFSWWACRQDFKRHLCV